MFLAGKEGDETKHRNELLKNFLSKAGLGYQFCQGGSFYVFLLGILNNLIFRMTLLASVHHVLFWCLQCRQEWEKGKASS